MLSPPQSLFSFLSLLCTLTQAKPHANPLWHHHHRRAGAASTASSNPSIGILYDGTSDLDAFSGKVGFSVDWSPVPLSTYSNLDLGTFIPQLWGLDNNRESPYRQTLPGIGANAKLASLEQIFPLSSMLHPHGVLA